MPDPLSADRSESIFEDYKGEYTKEQATVEANRCLFCTDAPCIKACPTHIDIPQFIRKIATDNVRGSARTIYDANILGMSCARVCPVEVLCVGDCVYNEMGVPPIQIGKLQRYATDRSYEAGWKFFEAGPDTGKSVALIGAGPASLAAAHELRRFGHRCTIYEKRAAIGGLNTTGVAPYKMKADRSVEEVAWILGIGGIGIQTNVTVGETMTLADLERDHDAVFVGVGLGPDTSLSVPGADLPGVEGAVDWIEKMKLGTVPLTRPDGRKIGSCVIVGGGNTALDVVREALGLRIPSVTMIYRGVEETMSGYHHEWRAAQTQGARVEWQSLPVAYQGNGYVDRVRCIRTGADKRPVAGSEFEVAADLVLVAIGQSKLGQMFADLAGIQIDNGRLVTDERGATGRRKWYAGGDCRNGGKEVVNAAAEGKAAARAIHDFLSAGA